MTHAVGVSLGGVESTGLTSIKYVIGASVITVAGPLSLARRFRMDDTIAFSSGLQKMKDNSD